MQHSQSKVNMKEAGIAFKGTVTLTSYLIESARAIEIDAALQNAQGMDPNTYHSLKLELAQICRKRTLVVKNLVPQAARNMIAGILNGELTYTGIINYGALGTSATAVSSSDTQLGAEVKRKNVATRTRTNSQITFDFYYSKSDTSGTYQEFGMVVDGTATANTGVLFNHLLTGGWTKSSSESLTVSVQMDVNAS